MRKVAHFSLQVGALTHASKKATTVQVCAHESGDVSRKQSSAVQPLLDPTHIAADVLDLLYAEQQESSAGA